MHVFRRIVLVLWTLGNHITTLNQSPFIATRRLTCHTQAKVSRKGEKLIWQLLVARRGTI